MFSLIILTILIFSLSSFAGLDEAGRYDDVVALYHFENAEDSGPREFDGSLGENASIVDDGKIDKCLRLQNDDWFGLINDLFLNVLDDFSIVAWIKMPSQSDDFRLTMVGRNDDGTLAVGIFLYLLSSANLEGLAADFEDSALQSIETDDEKEGYTKSRILQMADVWR